MVYSLLALLLLFGVSPVQVIAREVAPGPSVNPPLLAQIAMVVEASPLPMRRDFAWLAITEMAKMYSGKRTARGLKQGRRHVQVIQQNGRPRLTTMRRR